MCVIFYSKILLWIYTYTSYPICNDRACPPLSIGIGHGIYGSLSTVRVRENVLCQKQRSKKKTLTCWNLPDSKALPESSQVKAAAPDSQSGNSRISQIISESILCYLDYGRRSVGYCLYWPAGAAAAAAAAAAGTTIYP